MLVLPDLLLRFGVGDSPVGGRRRKKEEEGGRRTI